MELAERMAKTVPGQVTWADPDKGERCITCRHLGSPPRPSQQKPHICQLVKAHTRKVGVPFSGRHAIACSQYER